MNLIDWKEADATVFRCGWKNDYEAIGRGLDTGNYLIVFGYEVAGE